MSAPAAPPRGSKGGVRHAGGVAAGSRRSQDPGGEGSTQRIVDILEFLARRTTPAPAAIIAGTCGIPRSTLYVLLRSLKGRRYVVYHPTERAWSLGPAAHELSATAPLFAHGVAVLRVFAAAPGALTPRDIAARGELPRAVVDRILPLLEADSLVHAEPNGAYSLGLGLVSLASRVGSADYLRIAARPYLAQLRDATQETASLIMLNEGQGLYVDQLESPYVLRIGGWIGRSVPLEGTATGAAFADRSTSHVAVDTVETGVTAIACGLELPDVSAAVSVLAPTWRIREFGVERARGLVGAVARQIGLKARRGAAAAGGVK